MTKPDEISRIDRAVIALHDFGSREGATAKSVFDAMKQAGFTVAEIAVAARKFIGEK